MGDARKLSSMDASFLYLETPEMPMHVGSMAIFRLPEDYKGDFFEEFKAMIASRLHVAPILKARLEKPPLDIDANLLDSYQQLWTQPFDASAAAKGIELPRSGKSDLGSILFDNAMFQIESAVKFAGSIPSMLKSVADVVGKISDPKSRDSLASMASPPTILNKSISSERSFAGVSIPLSRAKVVAKQAGGKLNDVVLALSSGVVRRYLLEKGALPTKAMTAAVPISLREEGNTDANNQVFGMICSIATNIEDPKARLEAIIAQSTKSKEMSHPLRAFMPQVSN